MRARWWSLLLLAAAFPATADEAVPQNRLLNDKFRVSLGAFYAESSTTARLSPKTGGVGADVDFEDALGLEPRSLVGEASLYWRFGEHWRLDIDYFRINRSATRTLGTDVSWGGQDFPVGASVNSTFNISDLRTSVGWSFFRRPDKEVGVSLGVHTTSLTASLENSGVGASSATSSATAPLPTVGFYGNFALTDQWAFTLRADWLSLSYDKYSGGIRATAMDFVYQPFEHFAFGVGVHSLSLNLTVDKTDTQLKTHLLYQGPAAYVSYSF